MKKKLVSLLLVGSMVFSMSACGQKSGNTDATTAAPAPQGGNDATVAATEATTKAPAEKPEKISITCDGTVIKVDDNAQAFYDQLEAALGIKLEFDRPDHSGYKDFINVLFGAGTGSLPDVVLLSADNYATYASLGYLWNMTEAWDNSEVKNSGRVSQVGLDLFEGSKVVGEDGEYGLYGFSAVSGNGCTTYVKQSWLDAAGIKALPTTWDEYYDMLKKMKEAKGAEYVVTANGLIGGEAPYINYLPEFYQDAYPEFYEKDGQWVDGFSEDAMAKALERLATAYADGILDKEIINRSTSDCRNLYADDTFGVFTYWAGKWCNTLTNNLHKAKYAGCESEVLQTMAPIKEVGTYLNRIAPQWCITADCKNPEGVFEHYLQKMLDGREVQLLWEYGAEGTHYTYKDGKFEFMPLPSKPESKCTYNHIDGLLKLGEYASDFNGGVDIGLDVASPKISQEAEAIFNANSKMAPSIKKTEVLNSYSAEIWTKRKSIIADVVMGKMTVADGMAKYEKECGDMVKEVLDSLNN